MKHWRCLLGLHADVLIAEWPTLKLRCVICGKESPGIALTPPPIAKGQRVIRFKRRTEAEKKAAWSSRPSFE